MHYKLNEKILAEAEGLHGELLLLIKELCGIPAPSNHEEKRAAFCRDWFLKNGMDAHIDDACNVVVPWKCEENAETDVFMAHTDTVFPDLSPMPMKEENGRLYCPGVGDDTANLALLMVIARFVVRHNLTPDRGIVFVCNSGEEGLGNLRGSRKICETYGAKMRSFVSFDGTLEGCYNYSVGSVRYNVQLKTEGGHSFTNFGNRNAIAYLASLINTLYQVKVPQGGKTTFNVGKIEGGTSVNTIAQQAEMLFEYRSDVREHLDAMIALFDATVSAYNHMGIEVRPEVIGLRPCMGDVDKEAQATLEKKISALAVTYTGKAPDFHSGSTDCNIPFSIGVPSCAIGGYIGDGAHTREEWIDMESLKKGLAFLLALVLDSFRGKNPELFCG
ncbi:MAG: M20/M25/M40 family metallo-hydrolase [Fusobacteriaceae bacterium]|jgi:acetylornithine deacetylase/succinyl-diaminopimelate desuccinylase-like protein|nr:M20/M25/M40 family metallo-hydrolase [Fusobacteriaceae bacterium]